MQDGIFERDRMRGIFELGAVLQPPPMPVYAGLLALMIEELDRPGLFEVQFYDAARPEFYRWPLQREMTIADLQREGFLPLTETATLH